MLSALSRIFHQEEMLVDRANIITGRQGPQPKAQNTPSPRTAFELYLTADIMQSILLHTKIKIQNTLSKLSDNFVAQDSRCWYMNEVIVEEIYTFIALYLYRGLSKLNTLSVDKLISNDCGFPIFSATISRNPFAFIHSHLSFNDKATRENRSQRDRFAAIREVFQVFNFQCMSCLVPGDYLSLDETLYSMRTQISFK